MESNVRNIQDHSHHQARIFRTVEADGPIADQQVVVELKRLATQRDELNEGSPQIPRWAYSKAKKGIEAGEARHEVDTLSPP